MFQIIHWNIVAYSKPMDREKTPQAIGLCWLLLDLLRPAEVEFYSDSLPV